MVMLKTIEAHTGGCVDVQDYLERDGRAEALCVSPSIGDPARWAERMDAHRRRAGKDFGRKWYHFVLSPDPADYPTKDDVMALARDWAEEQYPGREYAIAIHADNEHEVRHAHVILNAYDPITGGKIQRSNSKVRDEWESCQLLGQSHGMTPLECLPLSQRKRTRPVAYTRAEREMLAKGIIPYKEAIRRAVREAAPESRDFGEFQRRLAERGIEARRTRRGITYRDAKGRAAKDVKLGEDCTLSGLNERFVWRAPMSAFARDWRCGSQPVTPPPPDGLAQALKRRARRRGIRDAKALAEIVALVSAPGACGRMAVEAAVKDAAAKEEAARRALEEAEERLYRLAVAVDAIAVLRETEAAYEGYVAAGSGRAAYARAHDRELSKRADAVAWMASRGLEDREAQDDALRAFSAADAGLSAMTVQADAAKDELRRAKRLAALYDNVTRPDGIRGETPPRKSVLQAKREEADVLESELFVSRALERAERRAVLLSDIDRTAAFAVESERRRIATLDERAEKAVEAARATARGLQAELDSGVERAPDAKKR